MNPKMPRPNEDGTQPTCWSQRTRLEVVLGIIVAIILGLIIGLLFLVAKKQADFSKKYCSSEVCLAEVSRMNSFADFEKDPCDSFYNFACGKFLEDAHGDEKLAWHFQVQDQAKRNLFGAYTSPIDESDHRMVNIAKRVFRACMNLTYGNNQDELQAIVQTLGGWPVVEGNKWNESNFDWVEATSKLREYGLHFEIFLKLDVVQDPGNKRKYIFKVETPDMWDYRSRNTDKSKLLSDTAMSYGANNKTRLAAEALEINDFLTTLQLEIHNKYFLNNSTKYTVNHYQQMCPNFKWLEFINEIASPVAEISGDDEVLFPPPNVLSDWIDLISKTPKRIQANYMMWKIIEAWLPYENQNLLTTPVNSRNQESREDFCLRAVQEQFTPSPIDIMLNRRILPKEKRSKVEQFARDIKDELFNAIDGMEWQPKAVKEKMLQKVQTIKIVVGQPVDYFDDKILDSLEVDLMPLQIDSFLNLMAQASRNHQTSKYARIHTAFEDNIYDVKVYSNHNVQPLYSEELNLLYIPAAAIPDFLYNDKKPNYLNFGGFGVILGHTISLAFFERIIQEDYEPKSCIKKNLEHYYTSTHSQKPEILVQKALGQYLSYKAYEKWVEAHGGEQYLITNDHSPMQLFWISSAFPFCQPISPFSNLFKPYGDPSMYSNMLDASLRESKEFQKDFECPAGSKMKPPNVCSVV